MIRPVAALISCVKSKNSRPSKAVDLYSSALFKHSRKYVERQGLPIFILSAKYGLIEGDRIIAPYEKTVNEMDQKELSEWGCYVANQSRLYFKENDPLLVLAGSKYMVFASSVKNPIIDPLKGLPIGKRLQWLKTSRGITWND